MKYKDYYQLLGVSKGASAEEVQREYRKLARQFHPDVNKDPSAAERFRDINEAYEVLKDPEKRRLYDELGPNWKAGQDFNPPPAGSGPGRRRRSPKTPDEVNLGDFSDFFESIFGGGFANPAGPSQRPRRTRAQAGADVTADISITLAEAFAGTHRDLTLSALDNAESRQRRLSVKIPPGVVDGSVMRLAGQGNPGLNGGPPGDVLLRVRLTPDPRFTVAGHDLTTIVDLAPWEAALGAKVHVPAPDGELVLTIPPGSSSGQRLRLRGRGLPRRAAAAGDTPSGSGEASKADAGDLYAELRVVLPKTISPRERELYEALKDVSNFEPRSA